MNRISLGSKIGLHTKHYIRKAKRLPRHVVNRVKRAMHPMVSGLRKATRLAIRSVKLILSKDERLLRAYKKSAHIAMNDKNWDESIKILNEEISVFGDKTPLDDRLDLARSLSASNRFFEAEEVIAKSMKLFPGHSSTFSASQNDLESWLALSSEKAQISLQKRITNIDDYKRAISDYLAAKEQRKLKPDKNLKIAVFSAISGGYDSVKPPESLDPRIDYIIFSDTPVFSMGIFDVKPLPYLDSDKTRSARFVKTNAQNLLSEYDIAVWIDANLMITGDIYSLVEDTLAAGKSVGAIKHPVRSSVYEEMNACIRSNKDDVEAIVDQRKAYMQEKYYNNDLIESNVLVYDLRDSKVGDFLSDWWTEIDKYSRRDQLSINYCLDKNNISWHPLVKRPNSSRNHPALALTPHGRKGNRLPLLTEELGSTLVDPLVDQPYRDVKVSAIKKVAGKSVEVIVCVHNAPEETYKCLVSIKKHRKKNLNLIIVDDGSAKPTADLLKSFQKSNASWVSLVRHSKAKGYTRAANRGMKESSSEFMILLNSDTIVTKNWYEKMADVVFSNKGVAIVGPMSSAASTQSLPDFESTRDQTAINSIPDGITVDDMNEYCEEWASAKLIPRVPLVHGFCFGVKREVLDKIGYFDEISFPRGYGEENDFCFRAADAGFELAIATHTYVYHEKSKSFTSTERQKNMNAGARAFRDKHGQRRITRAVKTMRENQVLQNMREEADALYARHLLQGGGMNEELITVNHNLKKLEHQELTGELKRLNEDMIDWSKSVQKSTNKSPKVSVIVLVLNNIEMTLRCIESVMEANNETDFELVVVSNGSNRETVLGLRRARVKFPDIKLVFIEQNLNYALGNNVGFAKSSGELTVFLNNDTYVTDYWLDHLIEPLEDKSIKATQPALFYPDDSVQCLGVVFSDKSVLGYALYANKSKRTSRVVRDRKLQAVTGACMAVRAKEFAQAKGFDPSFVNGQEDVDLCLRLTGNNSSNKCYCSAKSVVYHDESKTPGRGKYVVQNRETFKERWSGKISADDVKIYAGDGYRVKSWKVDSTENLAKGVPMYIPRLRRYSALAKLIPR